jgi:hypothetical protein
MSSRSYSQAIQIHPAARAKPPVGQACNGCGVCCLAEPCPVGILISGRRHGACAALQWDDASSAYRCGAVTGAVPEGLASWPVGVQRVWQRLAARWISAGTGCDCSLQPTAAD